MCLEISSLLPNGASPINPLHATLTNVLSGTVKKTSHNIHISTQLVILLDKMRLDEMGLDEMGINQHIHMGRIRGIYSCGAYKEAPCGSVLSSA